MPVCKALSLSSIAAPLLLASAIPALAQDNAAPEPSAPTTRLSVTGQGYVSSPQTRVENIIVSGSSEIFDYEALKAVERNAQLLDRLRADLLDTGIAAEDITTTQFRFERARNPDGIRREREWGYRIRQELQVTMTRSEQAGPVIDALVAAGAENINLNNRNRGNSYGNRIVSPEEQSKARKAAVRDARQKAEDYAEAMGMEVVRVISMRDGGVRVNSGSNRIIVTNASPLASGTTIDPDQGTVIASVTIDYTLKPAD